VAKIRLDDNPYYSKIVNGRNNYVCDWCGGKIVKGKHTYYNGPSNGSNWFKTFRFHNQCFKYLHLDERNAKFGFNHKKRRKASDKVNKIEKYLCEFWEAVLIPGSRKTVPFKREVEIVAGSSFLAKKSCEEEFSVLEYIGTTKLKTVSDMEKELYNKINNKTSKLLKKRLKAVLSA